MNHCYVTNTCDWVAINNLFEYFHHSILQIFTDVPMEIIARSVCSVQCIGKYLRNEAFDEPRRYGEIDSCHINVNLGNLYRFQHADSVWRSGLLLKLTLCFSMADEPFSCASFMSENEIYFDVSSGKQSFVTSISNISWNHP